MHAQELRLGNLVIEKNDYHLGEIEVEVHQLDNEQINFFDEDGFEPIPLTREIIENKCKFDWGMMTT